VTHPREPLCTDIYVAHAYLILSVPHLPEALSTAIYVPTYYYIYVSSYYLMLLQVA
jgi:hypothetical protein